MQLVSKFFDELTTRELYELLKARAEIFVVEQTCVYQDLDDLDYNGLHVFYEEDGKVPNIVISMDSMNAFNYGYLVYFFELACGVSAYTLGVNPFDQPGVEAYKKNMFALLGKPGYEDLKAELEAKLK